MRIPRTSLRLSFFFNDTATTEIYTLSLHDALPIYPVLPRHLLHPGRIRVATPRELVQQRVPVDERPDPDRVDRKSTRLNSSHANISYAVFCLKKKTSSQ